MKALGRIKTDEEEAEEARAAEEATRSAAIEAYTSDIKQKLKDAKASYLELDAKGDNMTESEKKERKRLKQLVKTLQAQKKGMAPEETSNKADNKQKPIKRAEREAAHEMSDEEAGPKLKIAKTTTSATATAAAAEKRPSTTSAPRRERDRSRERDGSSRERRGRSREREDERRRK
jgi:preprotein translocase subunit SecD